MQSLKRIWIKDNDKLKRNDKEIIAILTNDQFFFFFFFRDNYKMLLTPQFKHFPP